MVAEGIYPGLAIFLLSVFSVLLILNIFFSFIQRYLASLGKDAVNILLSGPSFICALKLDLV